MVKFKYNIGSRAQVIHGSAKQTGGGLTKKQLKYNKRGKIVSRKASKAERKSNNLVKAGYLTRKGLFDIVNVYKGGYEIPIIIKPEHKKFHQYLKCHKNNNF